MEPLPMKDCAQCGALKSCLPLREEKDGKEINVGWLCEDCALDMINGCEEVTEE